MTAIQRQAIQLIQELPDEKVRAFLTLAGGEEKPKRQSEAEGERPMRMSEAKWDPKKRAAFLALEKLDLRFPEDFDPDKERAAALEEKYGPIDRRQCGG